MRAADARSVRLHASVFVPEGDAEKQLVVGGHAQLGLPIGTIEGWAEADRRASRYRSTETLRAEGGEAWERFLQDPVRYLGADPDSFRAGVLAALHSTAAPESKASRVVVFTHGLPINIVLSHALGLTSITHFLVAYGSVTRLRRRDDGGYGVSSVNETGHHRAEAGG